MNNVFVVEADNLSGNRQVCSVHRTSSGAREALKHQLQCIIEYLGQPKMKIKTDATRKRYWTVGGPLFGGSISTWGISE